VADILRRAIEAQPIPTIADAITKLGRQHHCVATPANRSTDELLVGVRSIHLCRVEHGDAAINSPVDRGDRLPLLAAAVAVRHAHASEADRAHAQTLPAECSLLHR
jgi:hypothetical protein